MRPIVGVTLVAVILAAGCSDSPATEPVEVVASADSPATTTSRVASTATQPPTTATPRSTTTTVAPTTSQVPSQTDPSDSTNDDVLPAPIGMNVTVSLDKPTTINGEGPTVIWLSDIPEGWLVAESRAEVGPEEFFVLTAETADRAIVDIVAITEPGESYQGSSVIDRFASGLVTTLVVEGLSGPWELTIVSGDLIEPLQSPVVVEGVGDMAFVVAGYPSTAVVSGNKDGDRTFTFSAFGPDRTRQTGLVHDGRELSSVVVELPDNMSLYHVKCESSWTIEFD